jgi:hypothetical protein
LRILCALVAIETSSKLLGLNIRVQTNIQNNSNQHTTK